MALLLCLLSNRQLLQRLPHQQHHKQQQGRRRRRHHVVARSSLSSPAPLPITPPFPTPFPPLSFYPSPSAATTATSSCCNSESSNRAAVTNLQRDAATPPAGCSSPHSLPRGLSTADAAPSRASSSEARHRRRHRNRCDAMRCDTTWLSAGLQHSCSFASAGLFFSQCCLVDSSRSSSNSQPPPLPTTSAIHALRLPQDASALLILAFSYSLLPFEFS